MVTITWLGSRCLFQSLTLKGVLSREPLGFSPLPPGGMEQVLRRGPRRMGKGRQSASLGLPVVCCSAVSAQDSQRTHPQGSGQEEVHQLPGKRGGVRGVVAQGSLRLALSQESGLIFIGL